MPECTTWRMNMIGCVHNGFLLLLVLLLLTDYCYVHFPSGILVSCCCCCASQCFCCQPLSVSVINAFSHGPYCDTVSPSWNLFQFEFMDGQRAHRKDAGDASGGARARLTNTHYIYSSIIHNAFASWVCKWKYVERAVKHGLQFTRSMHRRSLVCARTLHLYLSVQNCYCCCCCCHYNQPHSTKLSQYAQFVSRECFLKFAIQYFPFVIPT